MGANYPQQPRRATPRQCVLDERPAEPGSPASPALPRAARRIPLGPAAAARQSVSTPARPSGRVHLSAATAGLGQVPAAARRLRGYSLITAVRVTETDGADHSRNGKDEKTNGTDGRGAEPRPGHGPSKTRVWINGHSLVRACARGARSTVSGFLWDRRE